METLPFVKAHWLALMCVPLLLLSFALGRFSGRPSEVTKVSDSSTHATVQTDTNQKQTVQKEKQKTVVTHRDTTHRPDGSTTTHEDIQEQSGAQATTATETRAQAATVVTQVVHDTLTVKNDTPNWYVGAGLGMPIAFDRLPVPFVLVHVDRRIFGPITAGVWGSLDVNGNHPAAGFSLGVSF